MKKSRRKWRDKSKDDGSQAETTKTKSAEAHAKKTLDNAVVPMKGKTTSTIGDNEEEAFRQSYSLPVSEAGSSVFERDTHTSDSQPGAFPMSPSGDRSMVSSGTINIGSGMSNTDSAPLRTHNHNFRNPSDRSSSTLTTETHIIATVVPYQGPPSTIYENEGVPEPKPLREILKDRRIKILIASFMVIILALVGTIVSLVVTSGKGEVSGSTRLPVDGNVGSPPKLATASPSSSPPSHATPSPLSSPPSLATSSPLSSSQVLSTSSPSSSTATLASSTPSSSANGTKTPTVNVTSEPISSPLAKTLSPASQSQEIFEFINASSFDQGLALQNVLSPQYQSFQWILAESKVEVYSRERLLQRYALITFYYILQNKNAHTWFVQNQSSHECQWPIVSCNANGFVNAFKINTIGYQIMLPGEFGFLTDMTSLLLEGNSVTGSLPSSLGNCTRLESFQVSSNLLTGTFPESFSRLSKLTNLDLSMNQFTGKLPNSLSGMSSLQKISIATNAFSGPIPSDLWSLTALQYVIASNNVLSGSMSAGMFNAPALLEVLLDMNKFTGKIPKGLVTLENTNELFLADNSLTGEIPSTLGGLLQLTTLKLANNKLTGSIPSQLGLLIYLGGLLDLSDNKLVGTIPTELGRLRKLSEKFDLGWNQLNGTIPSELGYLTNLKVLFSLAHNNLSGSIPISLGGLTALYNLHLQENKNMTGTIPFQLGQIKTLKGFLAYNNGLNGSVPESICNLTVTGYLTRVEVNCAIKCNCCTTFCY